MIMPTAGLSECLKWNKGAVLAAVCQAGKSEWNRKKGLNAE